MTTPVAYNVTSMSVLFLRTLYKSDCLAEYFQLYCCT